MAYSSVSVNIHISSAGNHSLGHVNILDVSNWLLGLSTVIGQKITNLEMLESPAAIKKGVSGEHLTRCLFNVKLSKIWAIHMEHFVHKQKLLSIKSIKKNKKQDSWVQYIQRQLKFYVNFSFNEKVKASPFHFTHLIHFIQFLPIPLPIGQLTGVQGWGHKMTVHIKICL